MKIPGGLLVLIPALMALSLSSAHAAVGDYKSATFNMQGSGDKWNTVIVPLLEGAKLSDTLLKGDQIEVLALQEVSGVPEKLQFNPVSPQDVDKRGQGAAEPFNVTFAIWGSYYIYFMKVDPVGSVVMNLAIVTRRKASGVIIFPPQPDNTVKEATGRPIFGVKLTKDGYNTIFICAHARSYGKNNSNDADNIIGYVKANLPALSSTRGPKWAILADFNRDPKNLASKPGVVLVANGQATHQGGRELDYMVAAIYYDRDGDPMETLAAVRAAGGASDHVPVVFYKK